MHGRETKWRERERGATSGFVHPPSIHASMYEGCTQLLLLLTTRYLPTQIYSQDFVCSSLGYSREDYIPGTIPIRFHIYILGTYLHVAGIADDYLPMHSKPVTIQHINTRLILLIPVDRLCPLGTYSRYATDAPTHLPKAMNGMIREYFVPDNSCVRRSYPSTRLKENLPYLVGTSYVGRYVILPRLSPQSRSMQAGLAREPITKTIGTAVKPANQWPSFTSSYPDN